MFKIDEITLIRVIYLDDLSSGNKSVVLLETSLSCNWKSGLS